MIYVVIAILLVLGNKVLIYDRFVFIRENVDHLSLIKDKWHTVYDPRYLVNAYHGMNFTENQLSLIHI